MPVKFKAALLIFLGFFRCVDAAAQGGSSKTGHVWVTHDLAPLLRAAETFSTSDIVILKENTAFYFYRTDNEKVVKSVLMKVNTTKGVQGLLNYRLPESFDPAYDGRQRVNGRLPSTLAPYTDEFNLRAFSARKFSGQDWQDLTFTQLYETYTRAGGFGPELNDEQLKYTMSTVQPGDIVEIYYEAGFVTYGSNLFYFNGPYPKLDCEYSFVYRIPSKMHGYEFTLPVNVPDSAVTSTSAGDLDYITVTKKVRLKNLEKITYPANALQANRLPHVYSDFTYYRTVTGLYPRKILMRPKNFEWMVYNDTADLHQRYNDKQTVALRKFLSVMPKGADDSARFVFLRSLCDSFNVFRYLSPRQLYLNENNVANVYSAEHLNKRRLPATHLTSLFSDILKEQGIFYYSVNVLDRRYGTHNFKFRAHYAYERSLFAVPVKGGYLYLMPRYNGVRYCLNELPYYFEDALGAFTGRNFQQETPDKETSRFRIEKLPSSNFNQNLRSEYSTIRVVPDSSVIRLSTKESVSGQFSTLLRHLYLKEGVDSSVQWNYFKRCVDKPGARKIKIKHTQATNEYPFRNGFTCESEIPMKSSDTVDLTGWFSVPFSGETVPVKPTHDYYFDFQLTDLYSYLFDFGRKVDIVNRADFSRKISNDYYVFESDIVPNDEGQYLLRVKLVIKKSMLPKEEGQLLVDLGAEINRLNSFKLILKSGV